jgi:serine protease AprX
MSPIPLTDRNDIQRTLSPTLVTESLRSRLEDAPGARHHIIIELNSQFPSGVEAARKQVKDTIAEVAPGSMERNLPTAQHPFVFAELTGDELSKLMLKDFALAKQTQDLLPPTKRRPDGSVPREVRAIFKIWESAQIRPLTTVSIRTVKADAAQSAFTAKGEGIVWAVLDSGIDQHPHFEKYDNLVLDPPLAHTSFAPTPGLDPLKDGFGHGTHVAGIIAGTLSEGIERFAARQSVDASGQRTEFHLQSVPRICGMAPMCKLLSLRILDDSGVGDVTAVINALEWIIQLNGDGSKPLVHGVNISAGYLPDPENYGSGQSPICRQVNRAVKSGLIVVVAAGNYGYSTYASLQAANAVTAWDAGEFASLADPGNADLAITVGSTHREEPHRYGISYFSSKGPTCDGRLKPDLVAPGERILSCAAGTSKLKVREAVQVLASQRSALNAPAEAAQPTSGAPAVTAPDAVSAPSANVPAAAMSVPPVVEDFDYLEDTGTSMAAPHVSGVVAAFLSVRHEFIGDAEAVTKLLLSSAMDLKRDARLQGAGLVDLFHMLQSV